MNAFERHMVQVEASPSPRRAKFNPARPDLGISRKFVVFTPVDAEITTLVDAARREIGGGADPALVCRVARHNPNSFWAIAPRHGRAGTRTAAGFVAFLMLNDKGMRQLIAGALDTIRPDLKLITCQNEKPAGIYVWGVYAGGLAAGGIPLALEKISSRVYVDVDLYSRAVTTKGRDILETFGFRRGAEFGGVITANLYSYRRSKPDAKSNPAYDTYREGLPGDDIAVTVVHTLEEMLRVMAIRSAVYIAEQDCTYREEFEGNDFSGSHLLAYVGDEPAGCLRIRYFAEFAKLERLAVLKRFRAKGLGTHLMRTGIELCRAKGYQKIYGYAQTHLIKYYTDMGFRPLKSVRPIRFAGYDYTEIMFDAARDPRAITLGIDPYVVLRPEGRWHEPGPYDPAPGAGPEARSEEVAA